MSSEQEKVPPERAIITLRNRRFTLLISGVGGLYWLVPAAIFSFIKAILDAWVLLVEINR